MSGSVKFTAECDNCGCISRVVPEGPETDTIKCANCGLGLATVEELNDEIARQIGSIMTDSLRKRLRRMLGDGPQG